MQNQNDVRGSAFSAERLAVERLVDRLRAAGVHGDVLREYRRSALMCGSAYIWKAVLRHEADYIERQSRR